MTNTDFIALSLVDGIKVKFIKELNLKRSLCTENNIPIDKTYDTFEIAILHWFSIGKLSTNYIHVKVYADLSTIKGEYSRKLIFNGYISFDDDNKEYSKYGANEFAQELLNELVEFWGVDELPPCSFTYSYK